MLSTLPSNSSWRLTSALGVVVLLGAVWVCPKSRPNTNRAAPAAAPVTTLRNHMASFLAGDGSTRPLPIAYDPLRIVSFQFKYALASIGANLSMLHDIVFLRPWLLPRSCLLCLRANEGWSDLSRQAACKPRGNFVETR